MKLYNKIIAGTMVAGLGLIATSCSSDWLEVTPTDSMPIEEYFSTPEHLEEAMVAAYDPLQWPDWSMKQYAPVNIMSDIMADQIWVGGSDRTDNQFWHLMMNYEALPTNCLVSLWTDCYSGVKRCNDVLQYSKWTKGVTDSHLKEIEAQSRVLRVYYYNLLWKFWGTIPYYETNLNYPYKQEQSDPNTVYSAIMEDLEGAIALEALPMSCTGTNNQGAVTKAMAYMLYAEIVMYQKDSTRYAQALKYMKEIIESGQYALASDYGTIFLEEGEWSKESIFEINYRDDAAVRSWDAPLTSGGTVLPRLISPNGWTDGKDGHDNGWGFAPVRLETYNMYDEKDARRDASCWHADGNYNPRYQDTGYFLAKYVARSGYNADQKADGDLNWNNNLRVYRYSECLLNAAELAIATNTTAGAEEWINAVHNRAGLTDKIALTLDNIKNERKLEFVGEGKRYWDLVRWGDAATTLVPDEYGYRTNTWSEARKYQPIPQSEIDASEGVLKQNEAYK